jgi:hypothetical protein
MGLVMEKYCIKKLIKLKSGQYLLQIPRKWVEDRNDGLRIVLVEVNNVIKVMPYNSVR